MEAIKTVFTSKSSSVSPTYLEKNGETVSDPRDMANIFNEFFCGIGHKFAEKFDSSLPEVEQLLMSGSFSIPDITFDFIVKEVKLCQMQRQLG